MADTKIKELTYQCSIEDEDIIRTAITLLDLEINEKGTIASINGGANACRRLNELGLVPGTVIEMVNKINSGPVMIRVKGSKLAIGRGLAGKVAVHQID